MAVAHQVLLLAHLIGFAALFGGFLVQLRVLEPEVNVAMLQGAWVQLVTGVALLVLDGVGPQSVNVALMVVKIVLTLVVVVLVSLNRKYQSVPRGLYLLVGALTFVSAAVSVLWQ
ncbi:MAG: hypothetical protein JWP61_1653 [Friedmanniella sp.]|nr:hypothetical protein [Friedmanniella sp.]